MSRSTTALLFFLFVQTSLWAQSRLASPSKPSYNPPAFLKKGKFQDLLPPGPVLAFQKDGKAAPQTLEKIAVLQGTSFKRRYLERQWQHLNEEGEDLVLLEQALLDQFGRQGFSDELGYHPYHESPSRRFQIVFLLSLPISMVYAYALVGLFKAFSNSLSSKFTDTERGTAFALGLGFSGAIGYYDHQRTQEYRASNKKKAGGFDFWKEKW